MPSIESLFPKHRLTWILWAFLLVGVFYCYYMYLYPQYASYFENNFFDECSSWAEICSERVGISDVAEPDLTFKMRSAKYVSDITGVEMPVEVEFTNNSKTTTSAVDFGLALVPSSTVTTGAVLPYSDLEKLAMGYKLEIAKVETENPVSAGFVKLQLPPKGSSVTKFWVSLRANGVEDVEVIPLVVIRKDDLEKKTFIMDPGNKILKMKFSREKILKLWFVNYLLSPPGANIFIPIMTLLICALGDTAYGFTYQWRKEKEKCKKAQKCLWGLQKGFYFLTLVLIGAAMSFGLFAAHRMMPDSAFCLILWFGFMALGIGTLLGCLRSLELDEKPAST